MEIIRSNRKLNFYSSFKRDVSKSEYLEQVKNLKHRQALAKLIIIIIILESNLGHTVLLNYLKLLKFVNTAVLTKLRMK